MPLSVSTSWSWLAPLAVSCRPTVVLPAIHSNFAASFRNGSAETLSRSKFAPILAVLADAVDGENAFAVSLIKLNVMESRRHRFVLHRDGDGRLADRNVVEAKLADVKLGIPVGDAQQREVQPLARPSGALDGTVDFGAGRIQELLDFIGR